MVASEPMDHEHPPLPQLSGGGGGGPMQQLSVIEPPEVSPGGAAGALMLGATLKMERENRNIQNHIANTSSLSLERTFRT